MISYKIVTAKLFQLNIYFCSLCHVEKRELNYACHEIWA